MTSVTSQAQQYSQRKLRLKRWVFRRLQKTGSDCADVTIGCIHCVILPYCQVHERWWGRSTGLVRWGREKTLPRWKTCHQSAFVAKLLNILCICG